MLQQFLQRDIRTLLNDLRILPTKEGWRKEDASNVASFAAELLHLCLGFWTTYKVPDRVQCKGILSIQMGRNHGRVKEHALPRSDGYVLPLPAFERLWIESYHSLMSRF